MAIERLWVGVPAQLFTIDGGQYGEVSIASTVGLKVKQKVIVGSNTLTTQTFEIKRIKNATNLLLGPIGSEMKSYADLRLLVTSANAFLRAEEQPRPAIVPDAFWRSVFEEEPTVALRTFSVDYLGNHFTKDNPFPVQLSDGSINIGTVNANLDVQLTDKESAPSANDYDIVRIGDGSDQLAINPDGSINVVTSSTAATTIPLINNYSIVLANTEYSYTFPTGTKQFSIKDRNGDAKTKISYISGNTNLIYETVPMGVKYEVLGVTTLVGFTIYFESNKANRILEIVSWS